MSNQPPNDREDNVVNFAEMRRRQQTLDRNRKRSQHSSSQKNSPGQKQPTSLWQRPVWRGHSLSVLLQFAGLMLLIYLFARSCGVL